METTRSAALDRATAYFGDRVAMVDGATRWTYRDLGRHVEAFDAALDEFGLSTGDVVGILAKNSRAHLVSWLGVPRSGRVLNEVNTRLSPAELAFILDDSRCRLLIVDDAFVQTGRDLVQACETLEVLVYAGNGECPSDCVSFDALIATGRSPAPVRLHPDIAEVAVFGVPDERWGEVVHAAVVLRPSAAVTVEGLKEHTRGLLAGYKVRRVVHLCDELPKSGAGKILKRDLRDRLAVDRSINPRSEGTHNVSC